jgi:hypothetical protein
VAAWYSFQSGNNHAGIALAIVALIGVAGLLTRMSQVIRQTRAYCDAGRERPRVEDAEFVRACKIALNSESAKLALTVRSALGEAAGVPAQTIHADDSMRDRIWNSIDMLDIHFRIERAANVKVVSRWVNESVREMRDWSKLKVSDFVAVILESTVPLNKALAKGVYYGANRDPVGTEI